MGQKLTLVVTCTDRKSVPALPQHQVRNLPSGPIDVRAAQWSSRLADGSDTQPMSRLYQGEAWTQVSRLRVAAITAGFAPRVLVVSAGLGLRPVETEVPAYAATFATRQLDSVADDRSGTQQWWKHVSRSAPSLHPREAWTGPTLFVLSESYTRAVAADLADLAAREDILIFGGAEGLPEHQRVAADGALRKHLGGTLTSLNTRMATAWLERLNSPKLVDKAARGAWFDWKREVRKVERFDRHPVQDEAILEWIRAARGVEPGLTRTRALRMLRDAGLACEQRRFGHLFSRLVEA